MSIDKSLKSNKWKEKRNIRSRRERVEKLIRNLKWVEGMSVYGLPKEVIRRLKWKVKKEKEEKKSLIDIATSLPTKDDSTKKKKTSKDDKETRK